MIATQQITPEDDSSSKGTILFVHGAWHASWIWANLVEYFSDQLYTCLTLDLRGHGGSDIEGSLRWASLADYSRDVRSVIENLEVSPTVIAHSMGGAVMMKYLKMYEDHAIKQLILLAPALRGPVWKLTFKMVFHHTWPFLKSVFRLNLGVILEHKELAMKMLFHETTDKTVKEEMFSKLGSESFRAYLGMLLNSSYTDPDFPVTLISAEDDYLFPPKVYDGYCSRSDVEHLEIKKVGHDMMVDKHWRDVASSIQTIL